MPLTPEAKVIYVHLAGFLARSYQTPSHSRYDIEEQWHAGLFDFLRNGPYSSGELLRLSTGFPFTFDNGCYQMHLNVAKIGIITDVWHRKARRLY